MLMSTTSSWIPAAANEKLLGGLPRQAKLTAKQSKFVAGVADGKSLIARVRHQIPFFPVFDPSTLTKSST